MAILNVTPDSFSDGGRYHASDLDLVRKQLEKMASSGVDIVDVGGESTRPNATPVSLQEELDRVLPVLEMVKHEFSLSVSVDTYKVDVMRAAIALDVSLINDVNALQAEGAVSLVADADDVLVCLMHKQGDPKTMQASPNYTNVVTEVESFLVQRIKTCVNGGIQENRILIDPGFGFGKNLEHNVTLFKSLERFVGLGSPVLVGVSRKKMIGELLGGLPVNQRVFGSVSAAMVAVMKGARVVRVHDFEETMQTINVMNKLL
ncbi:MAG TPA: dihydropteroate synthase [Thermoplasmata archaeon]|nr:dihydropteroate synthase [Thermoplasmata archaeon]